MYRLVASMLVVVAPGLAMDNLQVAYQWKKIEFAYPTEAERQHALNTSEYIPENNLPVGLEVYGDRLFITVPRWKRGVAASLAYIRLSDTAENRSPRFHPYPNWGAHQFASDGEPPQIVSPFRMRADRCGRLWVLDAGYVDILEDKSRYRPTYNTSSLRTRLLIYDLHNDQLLHSHTVPDGQRGGENSVFANIAVEDHDCHNSFAYLANQSPVLIVYSYQSQKFWQVEHHYFHIDPLAGQMQVAGQAFEWTYGLLGLALSSPDSEGYSTLYFHPLNSFDEFAVSTKVLRNESFATNQAANFHEFKRLGSRGAKGQTGASFLDQKSKVLFFASVNLNAVICWRTTNPNYTAHSHGRVFMNNETMVFPSDIKVDANNTLWVLSNRMPGFLYSNLNYDEYNFRVFKGRVADAIKNTACDSKMVINKKDKPVAAASGSSSIGTLSVLTVSLAMVSRWILK